MTLTESIIASFDALLKESNPDASTKVLTQARNAFLRRYGSYSVAPAFALAVATEDELLLVRNAGKKCQQVYFNAQMSVRTVFSNQIQDILELKRAIYTVVDPSKRFVSGVDRMVLQCIERGIKSKNQYDLLMPMLLAYGREQYFDGDTEILGTAYSFITRNLHPEVKDPQTYIVRFCNGEERSVVYAGVDSNFGKKRLVDKLVKAGYDVNVSGRINGLPIHFMNAEKKEKENETNFNH